MKLFGNKVRKLTTFMVCMCALMNANAQKVTVNGLKYYLFHDTHEAAIDDGNTWAGELELPSEVSYNGETYIVNGMIHNAFQGSKELTKVRIPKTIDHIINHVLSEDPDVGGAVSPDYRNPFVGCTALESVEVDEENPSMSSVGGILFSKDCTGLYCYPAGIKAESYAVPEEVTWIGGSAFSCNDYLVSVELPKTVTKLSGSAFSYCKNLERVNLSPNLTCIEGAFYECSRLKSIEIPSGVETIGERTFWNCTSLRTIDLPESVTYLSNYVFYGCMLDALVIRGILIKDYFSSQIFSGLNDSATLYVQASEVDRYKEVFSGTILPLGEYHTGMQVPTSTSIQDQTKPIYDLRGVRMDQPRKGIYIQNGQKVIVRK